MAYNRELYYMTHPELERGLGRQLADIESNPESIYVWDAYRTSQGQPASMESSPLDTLRRLAVAGIVRPAGELVTSILDLPAALNLPWPGGLPEKGAATRAWREYTQRLGDLQDTKAEKYAEFAGTGLSYAIPWTGTVKGLSAVSKALGTAARVAGRAGTAEKLATLARTIEAPKGVGQWAAREAAVASTLYPVLEAPKPEEERPSATEYIGTAALGGTASALLGRLARAVARARDAGVAKATESKPGDVLAGAAATLREAAPEQEARGVTLTKETPPSAEAGVTQAGATQAAAQPAEFVALTPEQHKDLLSRATVLRDYWAKRALEASKKAPAPRAGEVPPTNQALVRAARNASVAEKLIQSLEQGKITQDAVASLEKSWTSLMKNKKARPSVEAVETPATETPAAAAATVDTSQVAQEAFVPEVGESYTARLISDHGILKAGREYTGRVVAIKDGRVTIKRDNGKKLTIPQDKAEWRKVTGDAAGETTSKAVASTESASERPSGEVSDATPTATTAGEAVEESPAAAYYREQQPPVSSAKPVATPETQTATETAATTTPVPGSPEWNKVLRENPGSKEQMEQVAKEYWDRLAARLATNTPKDAPKIVYTDELRRLPEVAQHKVPIGTVSRELRNRGFEIGDPVDRILDSLRVGKGSQVNVADLTELPEVKNKEIALKVLVNAARKRGAEVVGGEVEMHAGIPPYQAVNRIRLMRAGNTRPTFEPIKNVTAENGSIPRDKIALLPDDIKKELVKIDEEAAKINFRIKTLVINEGHPAEMSAKAKAQYDKLIQELDKIAAKREKLREPVEIELGDIRKRKYTVSVLNALNKSQLIEGAVPVLDEHGKKIADIWVSPLEGVKVTLLEGPPITKMDEQVWRSQPGLLEAVLSPVRDVLGEAVVRPLRNAFRVVQVFESEFERELFKILKPVIRNPEALDRITMILEGHKPKGATELEYKAAAGMRAWYNRLFKEFGIDPKRFLENYAPRIRQFGGDARRAFGGKPPKELVFFAEKGRKVEELIFPTETNALTCALTYLRMGARKKFIQPALDAIAPMKAQMHSDRRRILDELVNNILHRPVWEERLVNGTILNALKALGVAVGPKKGRVANELSRVGTYLIYQATIAGNPMTALKNATQVMLSIGTLSGNPAKNLLYFGKAVRALGTKAGRELLQYNWVAQHRVFLEGMEHQANLISRLYRPVEKITMYPFAITDRMNVNVSYMMKLLESLDRGTPLGEAIDAANTFAASTQFLYGIDSPMLYKSPVGRALGILMSWPLNFARLMHQSWLEGGAEGKMKIINTLVGMTGTAYLLSRVTGLDFSSESPLEVARGWMPLAFLVGGETTSIPLETFRDGINLVNALVVGTPADREEAWNKLREDFWNFIPLSVEGRRIIKGIQALQEGGYTYVERAGIPYKKYQMSKGEIIRSFFGPTVEARRRRQEFETQERAEKMYSYYRTKAIEAYLKGDTELLRRYQNEILRRGGHPVTMADVARRLQEAQKTALERQAEGLPRGYTVSEPNLGQRILQMILNRSLQY